MKTVNLSPVLGLMLASLLLSPAYADSNRGGKDQRHDQRHDQQRDARKSEPKQKYSTPQRNNEYTVKWKQAERADHGYATQRQPGHKNRHYDRPLQHERYQRNHVQQHRPDPGYRPHYQPRYDYRDYRRHSPQDNRRYKRRYDNRLIMLW